MAVTSPPACRLEDDADAQLELKGLVDAAQAGDGAAWEEIYRALYPRLLAYARHHLGQDAAPDAVSDAMVKAISAIKRFSWRRGGFDAWMFQILRNVILDTYRRDGRTRRGARHAMTVQHDDCAERLLAEEETTALLAVFSRLDPAEQELLHLRVVAGLSSDEVARVVGKRAGAVRMAQSRALERLRNLLGEEGGT